MNNCRPRRLRQSPLIRGMVRETRISAESLILPFFVREGEGIIEDIPSLEGHSRYSPNTLSKGIEEALKSGVNKFLLFGVPAHKDESATQAYSQNGVIQQAVKLLKSQFGKDIFIVTDVCLCEYTSHGHCGVVKNDAVCNEDTLPLLAKTALSHAQAGSDMVAPSDMMDGRVSAIRALLDKNGFLDTPIMSYTKFSSAFYGPFREAAGSAPQFGDRKTYQMDYHNGREAVKSVLMDIEQGADIAIIKPALPYLDVISAASAQVLTPIAAYHVSGEYAMIKAAASKGLLDEYTAMCETAASIFRAGANILITYYAKELAKAINSGDIG